MDSTQVESPSRDSFSTSPLVVQYDRLRERLHELSSAPVLDMVAIDDVIVKLDEAHAAFKAQHSNGIDQQRF
jgi:cell division FtsZ-interacting protein ZapD